MGICVIVEWMTMVENMKKSLKFIKLLPRKCNEDNKNMLISIRAYEKIKNRQ